MQHAKDILMPTIEYVSYKRESFGTLMSCTSTVNGKYSPSVSACTHAIWPLLYASLSQGQDSYVLYYCNSM